MESESRRPQSIDEYIAGFPGEVQRRLGEIRAAIKDAAPPEAEETISYGIPTFTLNGRYLIYFAAYKKHSSLYPAPTGVPEFEGELEGYQAGKGTLQFPHDQPVPLELIRRIVRFRVKESEARAGKGK